jgi:potassium/hydrogen antiporter
VAANSPYLKRGLLPSWARPTLVVREQKILSPLESQPVRAGDYVYVLAPPEKAQALDRFFVAMPPPSSPDPRLLGDFFVSGEVTLGALSDIYGLSIAPQHAEITLADYFAEEIKRRPKQGDVVPLGPIALVAHRITNGRLASVGLRLAEDDEPATLVAKLKKAARDVWARLG